MQIIITHSVALLSASCISIWSIYYRKVVYLSEANHSHIWQDCEELMACKLGWRNPTSCYGFTLGMECYYHRIE
jgi:hypothetical protein